MSEDRLLGMTQVSRLVGMTNSRPLRERLRALHAERGDVLTQIRGHYYITESALRNMFPQIFSNTRSKVDDRFEQLESKLELLETKLLKTKQQLYQARVRIREHEQGKRKCRATADQ